MKAGGPCVGSNPVGNISIGTLVLRITIRMDSFAYSMLTLVISL